MDLIPLLERRRRQLLVAAVLVPLLACAVLVPVHAAVPRAPAELVLVVLVVAAAATGDRLAGLLAAASGALSYDLLLTEPHGRLVVTGPADLQGTVLILLVGAAVTELALWGQRQRTALARSRGYLDGVAATAASVSGEADARVADVAADRIREVLGADSCVLVPGPADDEHAATLLPDGSLTRGGCPLRADRDGLPTDSTIVLPLRTADGGGAHFVVVAATRIVRPTAEQRRVAALLAAQLSGVVETGPTAGTGSTA